MLFLSLVVVQIFLFGALVYFLKVVLTRNISTATDHLHELNQDYTQKLEDAKKRQSEADKYYDQTLLKAKIESEKIKVQIVKDAHEQEEQILTEARRQSEAILDQANKSKDALLSEFDQLVEQRSIAKAGDMLGELLAKEIQKEMHDRWMDELLKLSALDSLSRMHLPDSVSEAEVISAYALSPAQKAALHKKIKDQLGRDIRLKESADSTLIAGFKVKLASVVIDGSLLSRIKDSVRHAHTNQK